MVMMRERRKEMTETDRIKNALVNISLLARSDRYYSMLHGLVKIVKIIMNYYAIIMITVRIVGRRSTGRNNNEQMERICRNS